MEPVALLPITVLIYGNYPTLWASNPRDLLVVHSGPWHWVGFAGIWWSTGIMGVIGLILQQDALPVLRQATRFYLDIAGPDTDGYLAIASATSPENVFKYQMSCAK